VAKLTIIKTPKKRFLPKAKKARRECMKDESKLGSQQGARGPEKPENKQSLGNFVPFRRGK